MPTPAVLKRLPPPTLMKAHLRTCAMLDAIVSPDERSFEFHPSWRNGEKMGAFKDATGDGFFAWFSPHGAVVRGFAHESPMSPHRKGASESWPRIWEGLPARLAYAQTEPAFGGDDITFACWASGGDASFTGWSTGPVKMAKGQDADGAEQLLFGCFSKDFHRWAETYYDRDLAAAAIKTLASGSDTLLSATVLALNPSFDLKAVQQEARALGWATELTEAGAKPQAPPNRPRAPKTSVEAPRVQDFGSAEFIVRCEPARVVMVIHGKKVIAESKVNIYEELFDLVKDRFKRR